MIDERRVFIQKPLLVFPVLASIVARCVPKEPAPKVMRPPFSPAPKVLKPRLAPNAPEPLVEVPTPFCNWMAFVEDIRSGVFTQNTPWLSASFMGMPFTVTLMRVISEPRTRMLVYPTPLPASEKLTTPATSCKT